MRKYDIVKKIVLNKYTYAIGIIVFIVGWYLSFLQSYVIFSLAALGATIVIWMGCQEINEHRRWAKFLALVGKNTLPIYAIHYLFISTLPETIKVLLDTPNGFFLQLIFSFSYAFIVVIICLIIDRIISMNKFTRFIFFGEIKKREW